MRQLMLAFVMLALSPAPAALADSHAAGGAAVLTVTGGSESNRGGVDAFRDAFFTFSEVAFDGAYAFDHAALQALSQVRITANGPSWPGPLELSGPLLTDVMAEAGIASDASLLVTALDGYAAIVTAEDRAARTWIVALEADGTPLGLGGRGPTWILPDTGGAAVAEGEDANWVWSAYLVSVELE
ncbi:MAG: hypothetical protein AAF899_01365 [Pseudomonadota bacterium]